MIKLINRSAHDTGLPAESVHTVITSPPYFGLRKYEGEQDVDWPAVSYAPLPGLPCTVDVPAMRCPLGLEADPYHYVGHLVLVMREMHRVLRNDGTLWLNLGDSFAGSWGNYGARNGNQRNQIAERWHRPAYEDDREGWAGLPPTANVPGLKPKDMIQIPDLVSLALKADGWWVRSRLPWIKRNGMPGSQTDRPTTSHESIFVLAKSARYFWDQDAIRKPLADASWGRMDRKLDLMDRTGAGTLGKQTENGVNLDHAYAGLAMGRNGNSGYDTEGRYRRTTDWWFESLDGQIAHLMDLRENGGPMIDETGMVVALQVNTKGYSKAHFATWPPELVRPMIRASTSARGVCPACGAPWTRVVEKESIPHPPQPQDHLPEDGQRANGTRGNRLSNVGQYTARPRNIGGREDGFTPPPQWENGQNPTTTTTVDWQPTCTCNSLTSHAHEWDRSFLPKGLHGGTRGAYLPCKQCDARWYFKGDTWEQEPPPVVTVDLLPDDMEIIASPMGKDRADDPSLETGRAGMNRPRGEDEGQRPITRYEQRRHAAQLKESVYRDEMEQQAGPAFAHYIRTDRSGARPIPDHLLTEWIERGWVEPVSAPDFQPYAPIPATVLDPFSGSGTTGMVALEEGREYIGVDISKAYLEELAPERLTTQIGLGL